MLAGAYFSTGAGRSDNQQSLLPQATPRVPQLHNHILE
jgi:hypothetical protein